ncbi:MAG: P-type conjugative transfer protein VirB9 [Succinivibrio sp.]
MVHKSLLTAVISAALFSSQAFALATPSNSKLDSRIQYVNYSEHNVTKIKAVNGYITTITFSSGETVSNYGSGYSTAWEFAAADNHFFLKPKDKEATTNIVIVTNKHTYSIDVELVADEKAATYLLVYKYPEDEAKLKERKAHIKKLTDELERTDPNVAEERPVGNYQYTMNFGKDEGSLDLAPALVYDNGQFTYFRFNSQKDFPAIYRVSSDGESIVNSHVEKGVLVVHGVYKEYRLRAGKSVVGVYNENYSGGDLQPASGTTVSSVSREVIK